MRNVNCSWRADFNAEMQRAWEDGRKTQTRRVIEPQPEKCGHCGGAGWYEVVGAAHHPDCDGSCRLCPIPVPEQQQCQCSNGYDIDPQILETHYGIVGDVIPLYSADGETIFGHAVIEHVRVERVQEIDEIDAKAEGTFVDTLHDLKGSMTPNVEQFKSLWNSIHDPDAWDRNEWVWVIEFTAHTDSGR